MLREMSTTYGRSALGYLWTILEPVAGIFLLTFLFTLAFRSPPIGTNFPIFYASGLLPLFFYVDVSQKIAVALRFSRPLLFYPGVTYVDALIARLVLNGLTQIMVFWCVIVGLILMYRLDVIIDYTALFVGLVMLLGLAAGIGTLNCFLLSVFPVWERIWAILTRPLFLVSCIFFMFDTVPMPYRDWLWWNPLVHIVGQVRKGIYATYDATYVSYVYVASVSMVTLVLGLLLLRRYHRDIVND